MDWLIGDGSDLGIVVGKGVLMYVTALVALRLGERRTLAQWTIIDFATAVAMGAIIGRTIVTRDQSYLTGGIALVTLVVVHRLASLLRFQATFGKLFDHRVRVLVHDGRLRRRELRRCGLTDNDIYAQLRQRGVYSLNEVRFVLYETKGSITVVPASAPPGGLDLVDEGLHDAVGFP